MDYFNEDFSVDDLIDQTSPYEEITNEQWRSYNKLLNLPEYDDSSESLYDTESFEWNLILYYGNQFDYAWWP